MATETWNLSFNQAIVGGLGDIFPNALSLAADMGNDFQHNINVKEDGNVVARSFSCKWITAGTHLTFGASDGIKHYYKGALHKMTITRGSISHTVMAGIMGHKPDAYGDGVGDENNIVVFTGVKG